MFALSSVGCNKQKSFGGSSASACKDGSLPAGKVVATWNGGQVTAGDIDKEIKAQIDEANQKIYQQRKQSAEQIAIDHILDSEAKKKGTTKEALVKAEVEDKIPTPPDAELQKVFGDAQARLPPGTKFEDVKTQIVGFVTQNAKQEKMRAYFDTLRKAYALKLDYPEPPRERYTVAAVGPTRGPDNAKVTIVEFSDFECPFCGRAHDTVEEVMAAYAGKVKLVFRQFPLSFHPHAQKAAEASLCAQEQGKFWEYHDQLFKNQKALEPTDLKGYAKTVGIDEAKFASCLDTGAKKSSVDSDQKAGSAVGVNGTPAFFINGYMISGAQPLEEFKKIIDPELASK